MSETVATEKKRKHKVAKHITSIVIVVVVVFATLQAIKLYRKQVCQFNIAILGKSMLPYSVDNEGEYPDPEKWCDILLQFALVTEKDFVCPSAGQGRCHYAMNPNCEPNSPSDMVLLFETKDGWNQFGGPELLTFENHKGKGCNILFNDSHVEFVTPEQLGELKWKNE